jgi:hypothetical protein
MGMTLFRFSWSLGVIFLCTIFVSSAAFACLGVAPRVMEDIKQADIVFEGEVISYKRKGCPKSDPSLKCFGLIRVRVDETYYGEHRKAWTLYWWNSTFRVPEQWERDRLMIFAAKWNDGRSLPLRGPSATVFETKRPDLPQVLQAPCSSPFFLSADDETRKEVRALIEENLAKAVRK